MQRVALIPRDNHEALVRERGLVYNDTTLPDGSTRAFWDESACYSFTMAEVEELEATVAALQALCLETVEYIIAKRRFKEFAIPEFAWPAIAASWEYDSPSLYGRFDLRYDGSGPAKLLEYNGDTPTSLLEAAVLQWYWLEDCQQGHDQWNSLHERLVAAWRCHAPRIHAGRVHFAYTENEESGEDLMTVTYLRETARQAELSTATLPVERIGWDAGQRRFVAPDGELLSTIFKLYPWEWLFTDEFGPYAVAMDGKTTWIEPPWKSLVANKAFLAVLWERNPGHPNLLPCYIGKPGDLTAYARKPLLGREGANVTLVSPAGTVARPGPYGAEGYVYQAYAPLPDYGLRFPVLGAWVVDGEPAGLGIREADTLITDNFSRFVPHRIG